MKRVGYWITDKKSKKLHFDDFMEVCREANIELVKIDLNTPVASQGPFDLILHKLTDQIAKAEQGNESARKQIENLQNYIALHPEVAILDPIENVCKLLDRHVQYKLVKECDLLEKDSCYFMPSFVEFTTDDVETNKQLMEENNVSYPFVCKPSSAHGSKFAHEMAIIFNEEGLKEVKPPCVAQTFINHNAVLRKVFVIGREHHIVERPSLRNFRADPHQKTIHFHSHDVSRADAQSSLNEMDVIDEICPMVKPVPSKIRNLATSIQTKLGLNLIGIDVIVENTTGRFGVIDINSFPGYDGVPDFFQSLLKVIQDLLSSATTNISTHDTDPQLGGENFDTFHENQESSRQYSNLQPGSEGRSKGHLLESLSTVSNQGIVLEPNLHQSDHTPPSSSTKMQAYPGCCEATNRTNSHNAPVGKVKMANNNLESNQDINQTILESLTVEHSK